MKGIGNHKTRAVGLNISTKSIGSYRREVLDNDYKWPEGSEEEREAWQTAFNFSSVPDYFSSHLARFPNKPNISSLGRSRFNFGNHLFSNSTTSFEFRFF